MIAALCTFLALLAAPTLGQDSQAVAPPSPCPTVFRYDPPGSKPGWWSGVINLSSDFLLHSLWLDIVLDSQAITLLHKTAVANTQNFKIFRIEGGMQIQPGIPTSVRFSVQYDANDKFPRLHAIRLNGTIICNGLLPEGQKDSGVETNVNPNKTPVTNPSKQSINPVSTKPDNRPDPGNESTAANVSSGSSGQSQCGKVVMNTIPLVVNGTLTLEGQWPWQIALYQTQTVDNKYICGGTLVSHKHVITAAHCVTRKRSQRVVDHNTLTIYLGKHNLRTSVEGVQIRFVKEIIVNPNFNSTLLSRDVAILVLREPVTYSDYVRPACLWPDNEVDLKNVIGKRGSVVGWGFDETGEATEELNLAEMPVVSQETCIWSYVEFFARLTSNYTYCASDRDGTSVCNGDSGGGMVFRMNGIWYLRGLVSLSVPRPNENICDPKHYVIFTDLAKFLPWIYATVSDF